MLEDIAILTGATVISEETGFKLENATEAYLGTAKKVNIDKDNTTIEGKGDSKNLDARVNEIKTKLKNLHLTMIKKIARKVSKIIRRCCCN